MKRILSLAFAALFFLVVSTQTTVSARTLRISTTQTLNDASSIAQKEVFGKIIEEKSDGKYKIGLAVNGAFGSADAEFQAVMAGTLPFAYQSTGNLTPVNPIFGALDMPYLLTNPDDIDYIFGNGKYERTPVGDKILAPLEKLGAKVLAVELQSNRELMTTVPIKNLEDAQGVKIRSTTSSNHINALKALGLNPIPISGAEVFPAIQQGVVDGADVNIFSIWTSRFCDITKNVLYTDHLPAIVVFYTSQSFWDSLKPEDQALFEEALDAYRKAFPEYSAKAAEECVENAKKEGVIFTELSPEEKARWVEAGQKALPTFSPEVQEVITEIQETLAARNK